jgi:hypothetical protein
LRLDVDAVQRGLGIEPLGALPLTVGKTPSLAAGAVRCRWSLSAMADEVYRSAAFVMAPMNRVISRPGAGEPDRVPAPARLTLPMDWNAPTDDDDLKIENYALDSFPTVRCAQQFGRHDGHLIGSAGGMRR